MVDQEEGGKINRRLTSCDQTRILLPPRLVIAAPQGRSGKTTVTIALARALRNRGMAVQPFKKGPDYIDPSWLRLASGKDCFNLDNFFMAEDVLLSSFARKSHSAELAIIEGAMGLYDSPDADGQGSAAWLARQLRAPVILIVNTERMTRSVAALVKGFQLFEPGLNLAGVIFNRVSGSRHVEKLKEAVELHCGIPVLGAVPSNQDLIIAERHLGLIPSGEKEQAESIVQTICDRVAPHLNIDAIMALARQAPKHSISELPRPAAAIQAVRIGMISDRAFSFYYPENLEALREAGADVIPIDAFSNRTLPAIDGLYIGGGFPELYAKELESNRDLRQDIARHIEKGLPVYAECAGLMYLSRAIRWQERRFEMVGVIPAEVEISKRPQGHGYVELEVAVDNPWFPCGSVLRGHEFHHSRIVTTGMPLTTAYNVRRGHGIDGHVDGFFYKNLFASYTHLHALGTPQWAPSFVALAKEYKSQVKVEVKVKERASDKQQAKK